MSQLPTANPQSAITGTQRVGFVVTVSLPQRKKIHCQPYDEVEPRLGRTGNRDADVRSHYLRDINRDLARAGRRHSAFGSRRSFQCSRIGYGAGVGSVLASRDRYAAFRMRRVVIKTRLIKLAGRRLNGARAYLRYLQRDGVTREGLPGDPYDAANDRVDGAAF